MVNNMQSKFNNFSRSTVELKKRIMVVIFSIIIFRIGSLIPVPGINNLVLSNFLQTQKGTVMDVLNTFSGNALSQSSIFSLGVSPYISASMIVQLLVFFIKPFSKLKQDGDVGKNKIKQYTRYFTLLISISQAIVLSLTLPNVPGMSGLVTNHNLCFYFISVISLLTGTMILMWLGEIITNYGIGNGVSIIIFIGIMSKLPLSFVIFYMQLKELNFPILYLFFIGILIFCIIFFVIYIERSYKKINLYYAKHNNMHKMYAMEHTYLPLKLNMSGVVPAIFSSSIINLLGMIISWLNSYKFFHYLIIFAYHIKADHILYLLIYSILVIYLCFFYSNISFNVREVAENLKKSGAYILGVRPGAHTAQYLNKIMKRMIIINALYIIFICSLPDWIRNILHIPFYFSGTTLLIVVVVIIDCINQIQTILLSSKYSMLLKRTHINMNNYI